LSDREWIRLEPLLPKAAYGPRGASHPVC
jgi:transposase